MTEVVQLFLALAVLITVAKTSGYIASRFRQPAVLGELIAGVIIGPSLLNLLHYAALFQDGSQIEHSILEFAEIGVMFLMLSAGLEVDLRSLMRFGRTALLAGVLGVIAPILLAAPLAFGFGYTIDKSVYIGLILAATSVSISAQVMLELRVLRSQEGLALLAAAVVDDILVILLMSLYIATVPAANLSSAESKSMLEVVLRLLGYLIVGGLLGWFLLPEIVKRVSQSSVSAGVLVVALVSALIMGVAAEYFGGIAAITGAFIAGLCLARAEHPIKEKIEGGLHNINYGFFVPLFFVSIGLQADLRLLNSSSLPFAILLTLLAIISKIIGAGAGGLLTGFSRRSSLRLGLGMVSRGEVGLIVAALGIRRGIIGEEVFAAVVLVVLVTTLITPLFLRWAFANKQQKNVENSLQTETGA